MKFLENLCSEDDETVYQYTEKHYWYLVNVSCLYPRLDTTNWKAISIVQFIFLFLFISYHITTLSITAIKLLDNQILMFEVLHYIVLLVVALFLLVDINIKRKYAAILHRYMAKGFSEYDCETENYRNKSNEEIKNKKNKLMIIVLISYVTIAMFIFIAAPLIDSYLSDNNDQKEIYNEYGVTMNLPVKQWIPFGSDTLIKYSVAFCMQMLVGGIVLALYIPADVVLFNCSVNIASELDLLIISIERLPERTLSLYRTMYGNRNVDFNKIRENSELLNCYKECLKQNAKHHQHIIKMFDSFFTLIGPSVFLILSIESIIIGLSATTFVLAKGKHGARITSIAFCISEILNVFFVSWNADQIYSASQKLSMSLYSANWPLVDKSNARTILCMMIGSSEPLVMNYLNLMEINYETFTLVMNSAYSYLNLLFAFVE
ncbi:hypothetical protein O3M35_000922 [Rhynocoris fuscipes]|uniref:Odorant receptor n=1 Tax=Rhynocoris fuscipes TaxID=488301 RepID=A0AAW1DQ40_9HEMI